jgi:hypothetical protein
MVELGLKDKKVLLFRPKVMTLKLLKLLLLLLLPMLLLQLKYFSVFSAHLPFFV